MDLFLNEHEEIIDEVDEVTQDQYIKDTLRKRFSEVIKGLEKKEEN